MRLHICYCPFVYLSSFSSHSIAKCRTYVTFAPFNWRMKKLQYTKYRISKPWTSDTTFDDIYLTQPSKDDFAKFTKEEPIFLRFLKIVCDLENRQSCFIEFYKRCESGLVVEKDVYITKKELMECIWKNGFSEAELNAYEISFPSDYKFHYPELAALFDLSEEDCYKYCVRKRAENPEELVELNHKSPKNMLSSYGLCFLGVWFGLSNSVLSNAWFYTKTFPFAAVFYMLAAYFYRQIKEFIWRGNKMLVDIAKEKKEMTEDLVYDQMKKYANDSRCLEYLTYFKDDIIHKMADYRLALLAQRKQQLTDRINKTLCKISEAETNIQASLQEVIVTESMESFNQFLSGNKNFQEATLKSALAEISASNDDNQENQKKYKSDDPVALYFKQAMHDLQQVNFSTVVPDHKGSMIQRIAAVFQDKEKEFLNKFTVQANEAAEIRNLVKKCKISTHEFDFDQLKHYELRRLEELYNIINSRLGFDILHESYLGDYLKANDPSCESLVAMVNNELKVTMEKIKHRRLSAFANAFQ